MLLVLWFILWGLLWAVYFVLDGFDLGLGIGSPFIAKSEKEKNILYHAIGPFWNGNEVWLITAGGVTFAAFPTAYAVLFSSLYTPLMLILFGLIIRGVGLEFRESVSSSGWKRFWEWAVFLGSFLPAFLFGVAFANLFKGIPIDEQGIFKGSTLDLLNFYGLLGGILFVLLFLLHGMLWLAVRTTGDLKDRAMGYARLTMFPVVIVAIGFLVATWFNTDLYVNYLEKPLFYAVPSVLIPLMVIAGFGGVFYFSRKDNPLYAWFSSSLAIIGVTFFGIIGLYPNLIPSSLSSSYNITIYNGASSPLTLKIMLAVVLMFIPLVIAYQIWTYRKFSYIIEDEKIVSY